MSIQSAIPSEPRTRFAVGDTYCAPLLDLVAKTVDGETVRFSYAILDRVEGDAVTVIIRNCADEDTESRRKVRLPLGTFMQLFHIEESPRDAFLRAYARLCASYDCCVDGNDLTVGSLRYPSLHEDSEHALREHLEDIAGR